MSKAIYAGSFDPLTTGHVNIITRAAKIFDEVVIAVATNTSKKSLFGAEEKVDLIISVITELEDSNISVKSHPSGLTVDFAKNEGANVMIRGIRSVKDLEYEMDIAEMNKTQNSSVETIFLNAGKDYRFISSSLIKEIAQFDGDLSGLVPDKVALAMKKKYKD